jgi:hypothetical protein
MTTGQLKTRRVIIWDFLPTFMLIMRFSTPFHAHIEFSTLFSFGVIFL